MDRGRAAAALLALAACIVCSNAAPTASDQTALEVPEGPSNGCYYNFQHYGEGDRIMTNEPCLNCTCHNRMLMCYLRVCPFTKPIGQDCTIEKRADQCCPIVTCPDVPVDLLTSTSTSSPAEYGATGLGKLDKYGCSINGKYFPEGSKVPPSPNKPCEHCYCIRNMTTCVMQECTLHVDGCTPIYHKDVCCPVRYSCDHPEDEIPLLDDMTTTVRPTPGFLLTTTTMLPVTQPSQNCVHDDQIVPDGALIKTEKACEHCYCMKGDIVCVVQECGTPMENEGKNCTSLPPRQGQCCPDTYICEGDDLSTEISTEAQEVTTVPPRRVGIEGSGYRNEPDEPYTEIPHFEIDAEGSGEEHLITSPIDENTYEKVTPHITETPTILDIIHESSTQPGTEQNTPLDVSGLEDSDKFKDQITTESNASTDMTDEVSANVKEEHESTTTVYASLPENIFTSETPLIHEGDVTTKVEKTTKADDILDEATLKEDNLVPEKEHQVPLENAYQTTTQAIEDKKTVLPQYSTTESSLDKLQSGDIITPEMETQTSTYEQDSDLYTTTTKERFDTIDTTSVNPVENEIYESVSPISSPGRIPGEGNCLLNSITYENNSVVPSTNNCHTSCKCISSIIKCDPIICSAPPEYMKDCQPIYDSPESCCPTYVCNTKETIPPESHNQMSELDSTKPVSASECSSPDCLSLENNNQPITSDCLNDECSNKDKVLHQDTQAIPCEGDKCKIDFSNEKHPDLQYETPTTCLEENGCTKPIEIHTQSECTHDNCKTEPVKECSGSDCVQESVAVTISPLPEPTIHEEPINKLTDIPDVTDKIEIQHETLNTEPPTVNVHVDSEEPSKNTESSEEHITIPIKSSTDVSEIEPSYTKTPQSQEVETNKDITELPDHHTMPTDTIDIESSTKEAEQSTMKPYLPADNIEHQVTEADYSNEVIPDTQNKYQTTVDDDLQKTTITLEQATTKVIEEPVTDNQLVTTELFENKSEEPIISFEEEMHKYDHKETTTAVIDHSEDLTQSVHHIDVEPETTKPALDSMTDVENKVTEKLEIDTVSYPIDTLSTKGYELDENYTETPSSPKIEIKDKTTDSITTAVTESDIKVTEATHTSSESDEYKPISESTYDLSTDKIEQSHTESNKKVTEVPEIYTELPLTEQTKSDEQETDITEKIEVTEKIEHLVTEGIKEPTEVPLDEQKEVYVQTTQSIITDANPTEESKITETQHISVTSGTLIDETHENISPETVSTEKVIVTDEYPVTESFENEEKLNTNPPATTLTSVKEINIDHQDLDETEKKTTASKISTETPEDSSTASYSVPDSKIDTTISSLELSSPVFSPVTEKESHIPTEIAPTETSEMATQDFKELSTEKASEELPHTQATYSFEQHDSYTTKESYPKDTPQLFNDKDLLEIPTTTISSLYAEETKTPQDELLYTHENNLVSDKQDTLSSSMTTQEEQQVVSVEISTPAGVSNVVPNVESTAEITTGNEQHQSEPQFTTVKDEHPIYENAVTEIDTEKPSLEFGTTIKYEEPDTTDSTIKVHSGDDERTIMSTKPQIESSSKIEGITLIQETSTENKNLMEANIPSEEITEEPIAPSVHETKDDKISEIPEKDDVTTVRVIEIDTETKTPDIYSTSIPYSVPTIPEIEEPHISTIDAEYRTTPKTSDFITETTTAKEVITLDDIEKYTVTATDKQDKTTSSPLDANISETVNFKPETTTSPEIAVSSAVAEIQNATLLEEIPIREQDKETTQAIDSTTQKDSNIPIVTSSISEVESSTIMKDILPDTTVYEDNISDLPNVDEDSLHTKRPDSLETELNTEKDLEQSGQPAIDLQNEVPLEVSTFTSLQQETTFAPIVSKNISSPDSALSLVTDKIETEHVEPLPESTQSTQSSIQEVPIITTESVSHTEQGLASTEKSVIKEPEVSPTILVEPVDVTGMDIKTTSPDESAYSTESSKHPEYITEYPEETTAHQILDNNLVSENSGILQQLVTEKELQLDTETTDSTFESQSVTKESIPSNDQYEETTKMTLEKETEKETEVQSVMKESTPYNDQYEKTTPALPEKETEIQSMTKEPFPIYDQHEPTISVLVDKESEKDQLTTKGPIPSNELFEATTTSLREKDTENEIESQKPTQEPISSNSLYETTMSAVTITEKEIENQPVTEQSSSSKDLYEITTSVSIDKATVKEGIMESVPNKDAYETTTLVITEKEKETESPSVTKVSPSSDLYETTTSMLLDKETIKEIESQPITEESLSHSYPNNELYESTTLHSFEKETEKEIDSVTQLIVSSSESSSVTLGSGSETTTATYKIPEIADDIEKSTESVIQYSETTPYHIELQEHTHQSIDELSSKVPNDGESTTEQYVSEQPNRGDIPSKDDSVNLLPTSHEEDAYLTTLKEEKSSTTPTNVSPDRESSVHYETTTEVDQIISQSSSESPKEEDKYSLIPNETEKPLSHTPETETYTEKHIPDVFETHKTEIPTDTNASTEELTKTTTHATPIKPSEESTIHSEEFDKPEEKPIESVTTTEVSKPELSEPPSDDLPSPDFPTSGAGGYGQEPDYGDSEDQAFGPGTCRYGGKVYVSAQQIPRDDPCDFCFCFRSDIICLQQSCPPPIHGCHEEPIQGFCCPRYECPVSMATTLNVTTTTTTTTTTLPPHFLPHAYKGAAQRKGCQIKGHTYKVGEVVRASSGPCLHCTCGGDGQMKCDPKACTPEPMLRQMIAAAVSAKRRR